MSFHNIWLTFVIYTLAFAEEAEIESNGQQYPWKMPQIPRAPQSASPVPHNDARKAIRPFAKEYAISADVQKDTKSMKKTKAAAVSTASGPSHSHSARHKSSEADSAAAHSKPLLRAAEHPQKAVEAGASHRSTEPVPAHFSVGKVDKHKVSHVVTASAESAMEMDVSRAERATLDIAAASLPSKSQSLVLEGKTPEAAGGPSLMRREMAAAEKEHSLASFDDAKEREKKLQNMILDAQSNLAHLNALVTAEKEQQEKIREMALQEKMNARLNPGAPASSADLNGTSICQGRNWTARQCWLIGCCKFTQSSLIQSSDGPITIPGQCLSAVGADACDTGSLVTGPLMCENHNFDLAACDLVGCCQFVNNACYSAVGNNYCALKQTYNFASGNSEGSSGGGLGQDGRADMSAVFHYLNQA